MKEIEDLEVVKKGVGPLSDSPFIGRYRFRYVERDGQVMDTEGAVKIFVGDKGLQEVRNALPLRSKEMLLWVMGRLRAGDDRIYIKRKAYMMEMAIDSEPTFRKALRGLIQADILIRSKKKDWYFVNACHVFRGSRIKKWPEQSVSYYDKTKQE